MKKRYYINEDTDPGELDEPYMSIMSYIALHPGSTFDELIAGVSPSAGPRRVKAALKDLYEWDYIKNSGT